MYGVYLMPANTEFFDDLASAQDRQATLAVDTTRDCVAVLVSLVGVLDCAGTPGNLEAAGKAAEAAEVLAERERMLETLHDGEIVVNLPT